MVDKPLTLGTLFRQDMETANILPYYPTFYPFLNYDNYRIYHIQEPGPNNYDPFLFLYPGRICSVAGNEFPLLMDEKPCDDIMAHWKTWLPEFPEPVFKNIDEGIKDKDPIVTLFPLQMIAREKHAVDPDTHYHILLKSTIPETEAPCPMHYDTQDNAVFPCMVKVDQSVSGFGNYVCHNQDQLVKSFERINEDFGEAAPYIITEFVENVRETLGCQFYLNSKGEVHWLGTNVNLFKDQLWVGSKMEWDLDKKYKNLVWESFIVPVVEYLHNKGYFGIAGIDIICSPSGNYLVDINARITGSTPHVLIAPVMARKGLTKSLFKSTDNLDCSTEELIKGVDSVNRARTNKGKIIILSSIDVDSGCIAALVVFAKTMPMVEELFDDLKGCVHFAY